MTSAILYRPKAAAEPPPPPEPPGGGFPAVQVEVAFTTNPFATPTWTDISQYVIAGRRERGRQRERQRMEAGRLFLKVRNEDRRFEPEFTASPYSPNVVPNRLIRVRATFNSITYPLFRGYIDRWPVNWEDYNRSTVDIEASDAFKVFAREDLYASPWQAEANRDAGPGQPTFARRWYRLGDPQGSAIAADVQTPPVIANVQGGVTFEADGLITGDAGTSARFDDDLTSRITFSNVWLSDSGTRTAEGWFEVVNSSEYTTDVSANNHFLYYSGWCRIHYTPLDRTILVYTLAGPTERFVLSGALSLGRHHIRVQATPTPTHTLQVWIDNASIGTSSIANLSHWNDQEQEALGGPALGNETPWTAPYFTGRLQDWLLYDGSLSTTRATAHYQAGSTAWANDLSGARLNRILDLVGWPAGDRLIDAGNSSLGAASLGTEVLEYMMRIMESEEGLIYMTGDGLVRLRERHAFLKSPMNVSQATFADIRSGSGLRYESLKPDYDEANIINEAHYSREGGETITVKDQASQDRYLAWHDDRSGLLLSSDLQVADMASWVVSRRKDPAVEFRQIGLRPTSDDALWPVVLGADLGNLYTVRRTPAVGGAMMDKQVRLERLTDDFEPGRSWKTTWELSPAGTTTQFWVLGSSTLGVSTRLAF